MATKTMILVFSLIIIISSLPFSQARPAAIETLSSSGYLSMALTLQLLNETHILNFSNSTIFAPSDFAFSKSGPPSVFQIQYHILPIRFSIQDLKALPFGTKIPTLQLKNDLIITSSDSDHGLMINGVNVNETAVFDDGSVSVFGIDQFFRPFFAKYPISDSSSSPNANSELLINNVINEESPFFSSPFFSNYPAPRFSPNFQIQDSNGELHINNVDSVESPFSSQFSPNFPIQDSNEELHINNVNSIKSPFSRDGSFSEYGIDEKLSPSFAKPSFLAPKLAPILSPNEAQTEKEFNGVDLNYSKMASDSLVMASDSLIRACEVLKSNGYIKTATFLDLQLVGLNGETKVTIFAPIDESIDNFVKNFSDYSLIFRKHVIPSSQKLEDLIKLEDGTMSKTFFPGFMISFAKSSDVVIVNGVPVTYPDMFTSDQIVVHGVCQLLVVPVSKNLEKMGTSFSELDGYKDMSSLDYDEY